MRCILSVAAVVLGLTGLPFAHAQDPKGRDRAFDDFVGVWNEVIEHKPSKSLPEGGAFTDREVVKRVLKGRFLLGRSVRQAGDRKALWIMTYDAKTDRYPFWWFDPTVLGGQWTGQWESVRRRLTSKSVDLPQGWTSQGINQFVGDDSVGVTVWMKDDAGNFLFNAASKKTRQKDAAGEPILAAWSKSTKPAGALSPEMEILDRLAGSWETKTVARPTVVNPKETRSTGKVTMTWILDGSFLMGTSESSDGQEQMSLTTYDPQAKKYRGWMFGSGGLASDSLGDWDAATKTLTFKAQREDKRVATSAVRMLDKDRHTRHVEVRDADGKVYFDVESTLSRRKE